MYLGNYNFPDPAEMKKEYLDKVSVDALPDLVQHLEMNFEKVIAPQSHIDRMKSQHIESLINITRSRIELTQK